MEDARPLRAVTPRGVVPLRLCVTRRLTCCRCLPFLLASQTALTPSADPLGKPGLHHAHLPLLHGRAMASQAGRVAAPPADPRLVMPRRRQRAGTVQASSVRPRNEAEGSSDLLIRRLRQAVQDCPGAAIVWADIPGLSPRNGGCPPFWQQFWQQSRRLGIRLRPSAKEEVRQPSCTQ
jgi:hypothetical protein